VEKWQTRTLSRGRPGGTKRGSGLPARGRMEWVCLVTLGRGKSKGQQKEEMGKVDVLGAGEKKANSKLKGGEGMEGNTISMAGGGVVKKELS